MGFSHRLHSTQARKSGFCVYSASPKGASPAATPSVCVKGGDCHRDSRWPSLVSPLSSLVLAVEVTIAVMVFHSYRVLCARRRSKHVTCFHSTFTTTPFRDCPHHHPHLTGKKLRLEEGEKPTPDVVPLGSSGSTWAENTVLAP